MWNILLIGFGFGALTILVCTVILMFMAKEEEDEGRYWSYKSKYWSYKDKKKHLFRV